MFIKSNSLSVKLRVKNFVADFDIFCCKDFVSQLHTKMTSDEKKSFSRLPTNVVPVNYDLKLTPYLETFKFDGDVNVELQVCFLSLFPEDSVLISAYRWYTVNFVKLKHKCKLQFQK